MGSLQVFEAPSAQEHPAENLLTPVAPTLVANMERVVELAVDLKLSDTVYSTARPYLKFLSERLSLTERQVLLLSLFLEKSDDRHITSQDFARLLDCRTIRILSLMSEVDALVARGLILRKKDYEGEVSYRMPADVISALKDNVVYVPESTCGLTAEKFFDTIAKLFDNHERGDDNLLDELDALVEENQHLAFCKAVGEFCLLENHQRLLFFVFCHRFVNEDDDMVGECDWRAFYSKSACRTIHREMQARDNALFEQKIIENCNADGMADNAFFRLTDRAKELLFKELGIKTSSTKSRKDLLKHTALAEKPLFYNPREQEQIGQLAELLMQERFTAVQRSLESVGMRKGFACLFYGAPGTGKTETVYQLARRTQRDLMVIDVSQIKSCWVGESEKNIKAAFARYRDYVKDCERAPILLFNEADAVLGIRQEGAQRAVEKMENAIQNIILQEMEALDGILIATTNLTQNLDNAFERRFLYKIEFTRPSQEVKCAIWQSMIPGMPASLAQELASEYDFSGGQIENIARKRAVELILHGEEPAPEALHAMCRAERLTDNGSGSVRKIGF